jgi:hypothetical protein
MCGVPPRATTILMVVTLVGPSLMHLRRRPTRTGTKDPMRADLGPCPPAPGAASVGGMRALVVFESMFGNTEKVAGAVARGLRLEGVDTGLVEVRSAPPRVAAGVDLLVVGAPTHAFSMSRATTRADAVRQGAPSERATTGLREWLESVELDTKRAPELATFDTRVTKVRWLPKAAGSAAVRAGRRRGLEPVARPHGFVVEDIDGPLVDGELERAVEWGRSLAVALVNAGCARRPVRILGRD